MFKIRCIKCNEKVGKKYDFCPYCGYNLKSKEEDFGFLGKNDLNDFNMQLPFGFKMILKPLMKELSKQMSELDRETRKNERGNKLPKGNFTSFTIRLGSSGNKPIKIENLINGVNVNPQAIEESPKRLEIPKIDGNSLIKSKEFQRKEAETNIRRLSDRIIYELHMPGVQSLKNINMNILENGIEIKAIGHKVIYVKDLNVKLPLVNYYLKDEKFFIEMALR